MKTLKWVKIYYLENCFIGKLFLTLFKIGPNLWDALRRKELFQFGVNYPHNLIKCFRNKQRNLQI